MDVPRTGTPIGFRVPGNGELGTHTNFVEKGIRTIYKYFIVFKKLVSAAPLGLKCETHIYSSVYKLI